MPETTTETADAIEAGLALAGAKPIGDSDRFFTQLIYGDSSLVTIDLEELEDRLAPHPRRKKGTVHVQDAASFIGYIEKHALPCTEVYADGARRQLVGVINAHEESTTDEAAENKAGHGDHRVQLELLPDPQWTIWTKLDKQWLEQVSFAEHLEDNASDVIEPDAATMIEIAESFLASQSFDFKQSERLASGVVQFRYEETQSARAGHSGDLDIPTTFTLSLAPFVGADPVEVTARFRYRLRGGKLSLSYALVDVDKIARQAFLDHVDAVRDTIAPPVFQGRPE
jgi:uncharacterized protein YfdQ (DUF2303 family)